MSNEAKMMTAKIVITQYVDEDGADHVTVEAEGPGGDSPTLMTMLGILDYARMDLFASWDREDVDGEEYVTGDGDHG
jgi:hypothetical protein